jgi:hypothetical protein
MTAAKRITRLYDRKNAGWKPFTPVQDKPALP